jgi:HEAT repeat protein
VPLERIYSIQFDHNRGMVSLLLKNGDRFSCQVELEKLRLTTLLGEVEVPREMIRQVKVTFRRREAAAPKQPFHQPEPMAEGRYLREWLSELKSGPPARGLDGLAPERRFGSMENQSAEMAIRFIGPKATPFLLEMLRNGWPDTGQAVEGFRVLGELAKPAVPELLLLVDEPDDSIRTSAILALGHVRGGAAEAVPTLVDELRIGNLAALESLGRIGPAAAEATPVIIAELKEINLEHAPERAQPWVVALGNIGGEGAVPMLIGIVQTQEERIEGGEQSMPALYLRQRAVEALGRIGKGASEAVPMLVQLLEDKPGGDVVDFYFKAALIQALGRIGPEARAAVPVLRAIEQDPELRKYELPQFAASALARIEKPEN